MNNKNKLKDKAVGSLGFTVATQMYRVVLQLGTLSVMSRLLSPHEFGLMAMATLVIGIFIQTLDNSFSAIVINKSDIDEKQLSNLFWLNLGLAVFIASLFIGLAKIISEVIFTQPELVLILQLLSLLFVFNAASTCQDALLRRDMEFKKIAVIDITSSTIGSIIGILFAIFGFKALSLVYMAISVAIIKGILRVFYKRWWPGTITKNSKIFGHVVFGMRMAVANLTGYISNNLGALSIGYVGGSYPLGLYNRANAVTGMLSTNLLPPINNVVHPSLVKLKANGESLIPVLLFAIRIVALFTTLLTLLLFIFADEVTMILLGPEWHDAIIYIKLLAIYSFVQPIAGLLSTFLVATGNASVLLKSRLESLCVSALCIAIGIYWGPIGILLAFSISGILIRLPLFLRHISKTFDVNFWNLIKCFLPSFCAGSITLVVISYMIISFDNETFVSTDLLILIATCFIYFFVTLLSRSMRFDVMHLVNAILANISKKIGAK